MFEKGFDSFDLLADFSVFAVTLEERKKPNL